MRDYSKNWRQLQDEQRKVARIKFGFLNLIGFGVLLMAYFYFAEKAIGQMQIF